MKFAINLFLRTGDRKGQRKCGCKHLEAQPFECSMSFKVKFADKSSGRLCVFLGAPLGHTELPHTIKKTSRMFLHSLIIRTLTSVPPVQMTCAGKPSDFSRTATVVPFGILCSTAPVGELRSITSGWPSHCCATALLPSAESIFQ